MLLGVLQPRWHLSCPSPAPLLGLGLVPALELIQRSHAGLTSMGGSQEKRLHLHWLTIQIRSLFGCRFVWIMGPSGCCFWQQSALLSHCRVWPWSRMQRNSREGRGERDFRKSVSLLCTEQQEGGVGTLGWFPWE